MPEDLDFRRIHVYIYGNEKASEMKTNKMKMGDF